MPQPHKMLQKQIKSCHISNVRNAGWTISATLTKAWFMIQCLLFRTEQPNYKLLVPVRCLWAKHFCTAHPDNHVATQTAQHWKTWRTCNSFYWWRFTNIKIWAHLPIWSVNITTINLLRKHLVKKLLNPRWHEEGLKMLESAECFTSICCYKVLVHAKAQLVSMGNIRYKLGMQVRRV